MGIPREMNGLDEYMKEEVSEYTGDSGNCASLFIGAPPGEPRVSPRLSIHFQDRN
jgi:hypothetical protein